MGERYRKELNWRFAEFSAESQVEHYLELFPELKSRLSKFGVGIFIWNMTGEINIENPDDVERVHQILNVLDQTPGFNFFDNVFNKCSPDTVCEIIGLKPMCLKEEHEITFDYYVYSIK